LGQKVNPIGLRVTVEKDWRSRWFSRKKDFGTVLIEDLANRVRVNIHSARPGVIIGRKGQDIEKIRTDLSTMTGKEIYVEIHEVKSPDSNAQLVAENICSQLERRVSFRRAMKRAMKVAMDMGVNGIKIRASGRLGGAELSRVEWYKEGTVPLHTLRANISYGFAEAATTAGRIGLKVWICKPREEPKAPRGKGQK
jgi:small subunit ribosomal protein S3